MIGKFLQPSSAKLSPTVEAEGSTSTTPMKDSLFPSPTINPSGFEQAPMTYPLESHPLEVQTSEALKVRVKRKSKKHHDTSLPAKFHLKIVGPKDSLLESCSERKDPEQEPPRKKMM